MIRGCVGKIYTKAGDTGETGLYGGQKVSKDHRRIRTYGTFDELNAVIGLVLSESEFSMALLEMQERLQRVQAELFLVCSELAAPANQQLGISTHHVSVLELEIDQMEAQLKPLTRFILPGGSRMAATLHLARTVCRRAERELVTLHHEEPVRKELLEYVNRLSDYLFVCARFANHSLQIADVPWISA